MPHSADPSQLSAFLPVHSGVVRDGKIELNGPVPWPEGTGVQVQIARPEATPGRTGHAIIVGFGPVGRWAADVLERYRVPFVLIERNPVTVAAQQGLGRTVVEGDASVQEVLDKAGVTTARFLILTIPEEEAGLRAVEYARSVNPSLLIMARMEHPSSAMRARQVGADIVISAEICVAKEFHESLLVCLASLGLPADASQRQTADRNG